MVAFDHTFARTLMSSPSCKTWCNWNYHILIKHVCRLSNKFFANHLYLKNFHNDSRKTSVSDKEENWLRRCMKHNVSLWFPQLTQIKWGIVFLKYRSNPPLSPELTLVVSMHANRALIKSTDWFWKYSSKDVIMLATYTDVPTTLLKG